MDPWRNDDMRTSARLLESIESSQDYDRDETLLMTGFRSYPDPHVFANQGPTCIILLVGLLFLFGGVIPTFTGKALTQGKGLVYRAENPNAFWAVVVTNYLCDIGLIGYYFFNFDNGRHDFMLIQYQQWHVGRGRVIAAI